MTFRDLTRRLLHALVLGMLAFASLSASASAHHTQDEIVEIIEDRAAERGAPVGVLLALARCESRMGQDTYNPRSGATGVFQWMQGGLWLETPAWQVWHINLWTAYGEDHDGSVWIDCDMAAWAIASGRRGSWSC